MKKSLLLLAAGVLGLGSLSAQTTDIEAEEEQVVKFRDNWSVGVNVGIVSPLVDHAFFDNARANMGINVNKQLSAIYGLTVEYMWSINTFESNAAFDAANLMLLHRINLNNVFTKYKGKPSLFEVELLAGMGWLHENDHYYNSNGDFWKDGNWVSSKVGFNFNFNIGEKKAWTVAIKPAIVWNLSGAIADGDEEHLQYNVNRAVWDISVGAVYRFKNSNGKHYYSNSCRHTGEIAALNATIGNLQGELAGKDRALHNAQGTINDLQHQLDECRNRKPEPAKEIVAAENEYLVFFRQSSSKVDAMQKANVERLANYLKKNANAKVTISGYASPEGNAEYNQKLSEKRAQSVKNLLVKEYGISESRIIKTEGKGVGTIFETPKYNRVSICVTE